MLAFQAIFLGIYFTALFMSQFLFSFKYWEISLEFPKLLGQEVEQVRSKMIKLIEVFFMVACVVLPITVAFLRFVYIKNALDPNNTQVQIGQITTAYIVLLQFALCLAIATIFFLVNGLLRIRKCIKGYQNLVLNQKLIVYQIIGFSLFTANLFLYDLFVSLLADFNINYPTLD